MTSIADSTEYEILVARIDQFIIDKLERGCFAPSVIGTELIYHALYLSFPDEPDAFATFSDRVTDHDIRIVEDPYTGADLVVGVKLKTEYVPSRAPRVHAFRTSLVRD
jgi:hypothetical protein